MGIIGTDCPEISHFIIPEYGKFGKCIAIINAKGNHAKIFGPNLKIRIYNIKVKRLFVCDFEGFV
jgi:hypothetical protein